MDLKAFFEAHPRVAIAFSGGVDSTYLVTAAAQYAQSVHAYTIDSAFVPRFELEGAKALTKKIGITHTLLPIDVLQNETVVQNPKDRCYFCKKAVFSTIWKAAKKDGYNLLLDGTNASDDASDRPGMKALAELDVLSPLRLRPYQILDPGKKQGPRASHLEQALLCLPCHADSHRGTHYERKIGTD